jgi:isocitrate dehydrogenase
LNKEETSTNSTAIIFAWSGALKKRGELDDLPELVAFARSLENATRETIENDRIMTGDLARISEPPANKIATTTEFIDAVARRIK